MTFSCVVTAPVPGHSEQPGGPADACDPAVPKLAAARAVLQLCNCVCAGLLSCLLSRCLCCLLPDDLLR